MVVSGGEDNEEEDPEEVEPMLESGGRLVTSLVQVLKRMRME
jgi:hypothetical protein